MASMLTAMAVVSGKAPQLALSPEASPGSSIIRGQPARLRGLLLLRGNRYGLGITNAPGVGKDFAIGIGGGVVGGAVCGAVGGALGPASLPMAANGFARSAAGDLGNQIGQTARSIGVNNVVNYSNFFNDMRGP